MEPLEVCRLVDGDVSVDGHEDDDVDGAGHEGVDEGQLEMSLEEGGSIMTSTKTSRDVKESRNCGDKYTEV